MKNVRVRIAPSPTGYPHIGTIYQAMFDFVFAKKYGGKFIVRIEDTDRNRFVEKAEEIIFNSLDWFGLKSDENPKIGGPYAPYRQSERLDIYKKYAFELVEKGHAYYCFCTKERLEKMRGDQETKKLPPMYDKTCLNLNKDQVEENLKNNIPYVIRMKVPENRKVVVLDTLAGEIGFNSSQIDHQVILKSDGFPTYHLAVVVDDYLMKVTHVFRGKEWLPSTPKHILLYEFLGWEDSIPTFIHLPVILNADGKGKLSKRLKTASVDYYKNMGFLPEAILNYLANIVWNHPEGKEIYPLMDLGLAFHEDPFRVDVTSSGPRFDLTKLEWMNGEYLRKMDDESLSKRLMEFLGSKYEGEVVKKLVPLTKERIKKFADFIPLTSFIFEEPKYDMEVLSKVKIESPKEILEEVIKTLDSLGKPWKVDAFEKTFRQLAEKLEIKVGDFFQLFRFAISGKLVTPPLFESIQILGEKETIDRIKKLVVISNRIGGETNG